MAKRPTVQLLSLEVEGVRHDVLWTFDAAAKAAKGLEHAGAAAFVAATMDAFADDDAEALDARAVRLRGAALHALMLAAELVSQAGRLEQLASVRRSAGAETD